MGEKIKLHNKLTVFHCLEVLTVTQLMLCGLSH